METTNLASSASICCRCRLRNVSQRTKLNISKIVRCLIMVAMLVSSCDAYPRVEEERGDIPGALYFKANLCEPRSEHDLSNMLSGSDFDRSMATNNEEEAKRNFLAKDNSEKETDSEDVADSIYQGDDPNAGSFEDEYEDGYSNEEEQSWPPKDSKSDHHDDDFSGKYLKKRDFQFMRRKRREVSDDGHLLHLKLLLARKRNKKKKLRKQLKKKLKQKIRDSNILIKSPPWACELNQTFERKEGYFPLYVRSGRCKTDKCFYRLYDCRPQWYTITLLQKDTSECNPIPRIGLNTTYEEKWNFIKHPVVVGCNCVQRGKTKKRRRH